MPVMSQVCCKGALETEASSTDTAAEPGQAVRAVGQRVPAAHEAPARLSPAILSPVTRLLPWRADLALHTHDSRVALLCQGNLLSLWSSQ